MTISLRSIVCSVLILPVVAVMVSGGEGRADLVGWWSFEDTLEDQSASALGGSAIGDPAFDPDVPAGTGSSASLRFDGSSMGVNVAASPSMDSGVFTLAYFVNPDDAVQNGGFERLTSRGGDSFETALNGAYELSYFGPGGGGGPGWVTTGATVAADDWTHVAWRNTGTGPDTIELFVDGESVWTGSGVGAPSGLFNIGIRHNNVEGYEGLLDDVLLWDDSNNPLTDEQIAQIAEVGVAAFLGEDVDLDNDGLPNVWEEANGLDPEDDGSGDPNNGPDGDPDDDGLNNLGEFEAGTDPNNPDTDGDTINDGDEIAAGTNPKSADTDGDGLSDAEEQGLGTDPTSKDSDGDGFEDGLEIDRGSDPTDANSVPDIDEDFVLHLAFDDGDLTDQTGHGNDGTILGMADFDDNVPDGFPGQSIRFNEGGVESDGVMISPDPSLDSETFTLAYWLNPDGAVQNGPAGFERLTSRGSDSFETAISSTNELSYFGPAGGGGPGWIRTGMTVPGEEWTHVAWRNTGAGPNNIELFVNGESSFVGSGVGAPSGLMNIGIRHNGIEGYEGLIDDVRLYAIALSEDQILDLLEGGPGEDTLKLDVNASGDDLVLTWMSRPGLLYRVRSDGDLQPEPGAWPVIDGNEDIAATPPLNTLTIPRPAEDQLFFVVEEYFPPPVSVFSDDFESGQGDWTVGSEGAAGTAWEFGMPTNVGPAPPVVSSNCAGTNLSSDYALDANVWLRSPVIDLTEAVEATLRFRQFKDIEEGFDFGSLRVLDADNGDAELVVLIDAVSGVTLDWEEESISLPEVALGRNVKLEFRLQSDDVQNFAGWYIDDVEVTVP